MEYNVIENYTNEELIKRALYVYGILQKRREYREFPGVFMYEYPLLRDELIKRNLKQEFESRKQCHLEK